MGGTYMAMQRWAKDPAFYRDRLLPTGTVLDIGPGGDPLARYAEMFPLVEQWTCLDHQFVNDQHGAECIQGDAVEGADRLYPRQFSLVFSSHCLEHVDDPSRALRCWWALVKPGGYLVVIVPSWLHYERRVWPPRFNTDHRTAWVLYLSGTPLPFIRGLINECGALGGTILRANTLDAGFRPGEEDQTASHACESGLEVVVQKAAA